MLLSEIEKKKFILHGELFDQQRHKFMNLPALSYTCYHDHLWVNKHYM